MMLRRLISVGMASLVLAGALVARTFIPNYLLQTWQVQAQSAMVNNRVGPNTAQVQPVLPDVTGVPVVVILPISWENSWKDTISLYGGAQPLVIRISEVNAQTATTTDWAAKGRILSTVLGELNRTDAIVVFGNELNNLDREWKSVSEPPANIPAAMNVAAQEYGRIYRQFQGGLSSSIKLAPAPPDVTNGVYPWEPWITASGVYQGANAHVMNVYQRPELVAAGRDIPQLISAYQAAVGGANIDFFTEVGIDPRITDLTQHVNFLNTVSLPAPAATLVPNHCASQPWGDGANLDDWLFYVNGKLYDRNGSLIDPATCGANTVLIPEGKPVFLYPDPNLDYTTFTQELDMYLANSQVYCAPPQVFWPEYPYNTDPPVQYGGQTIGTSQYPPVEVEESVSLTPLSFPLFRSDRGGVSIESDLSRVKAGESVADAIVRNSRVDSAPQFYLSTPHNQCTNAAQYVQHVIELCQKDGFDTTNPSSPELEDCAANIGVKMANGEYRRIIEFSASEYLPNTNVCESYTLDEISQISPRARAVQAISPYTPKVFKMGFYVQHTHLSGSTNTDRWHNRLVNVQQMVAWFSGQGTKGNVPEPQERIDVVPVWYHAGLTSSQFDQTQLQPYSIDLREYSTDGSIQVKDFDPAARSLARQQAQATGSVLNPKTTSVAEPLVNPENYMGPLWRTYSFVMPQHIQENIALRRLQLTYQNYYLLDFMRNGLGRPRSITRQEIADGLGVDIITKLRLEKERFWANAQFDLPFECSSGVGNNDPAYIGCTEFREFAYDPDGGYDGLTPGQTYADIGAAFPKPVTIASRSQMDFLKKSLIARINAGIQESRAYTPNPAEGELVGPVSDRRIGVCAVDQENVRYGVRDSASEISSAAIQPLENPDDEQTTPARNPITVLRNRITAWIMAQTSPAGDAYITDRVTSAYLILPDEAMGIETLQSYLSSMFLSPEMYRDIMSGGNEVYPFAELWQQLLAKENFTGEAAAQLSAFMTTGGPLRSVTGEDEGFIRARQVAYAPITVGCDEGVEICGCGQEIPGTTTEIWMTVAEYNGAQRPSPATSCFGSEEVERRVINVLANQPGKSPNMGVNVPGNTFAFGEFIRRLAFTPTHMQKNAVYTGLENFYKGLGDVGGPGSGAVVGGQCAYSTPTTYDIRDQGYTPGNIESIRGDLCEGARVGNYDVALVRALLEIEGGAVRDALKGSRSPVYNCAPNSYGAVGPFQRVIGQCSSRPTTQNFFLEDNTKNPDMCTISGSLPALARHLKQLETSAPARGSLEYYAYMAEGYIGRGSCGDLSNPIDGAAKAMPQESSVSDFCYGNTGRCYPRNEVDYCAYVADRAIDDFQNYCR